MPCQGTGTNDIHNWSACKEEWQRLPPCFLPASFFSRVYLRVHSQGRSTTYSANAPALFSADCWIWGYVVTLRSMLTLTLVSNKRIPGSMRLQSNEISFNQVLRVIT